MKKRHVYPIVRHDEYLSAHDVDISMLISVVKVLQDEGSAEHEAQRLNDLRPDNRSRYWATLSRMPVVAEEGTPEDKPDFTRQALDLAAAIRLGYEIERDDPNIGFDLPPADEIQWLAGWLVSEGWGRTPRGSTCPKTRTGAVRSGRSLFPVCSRFQIRIRKPGSDLRLSGGRYWV